jgi:hypothetical protein
MTKFKQRLLRGKLNNEGWKDRRVEGKKLRSSKMRLKASIPFLFANFNELYNIRYFVAFPAGGRKNK